MQAIIIKGNPKFINNDLARKYYEDIKSFLESFGFKVEFNAGNDYTRPRQNADLYIGHSRGAGRYEFMDEKNKVKFLRFGDPDGIIDPVDAKWQKENPPPTDAHPPKEHFTFSKEQRNAIREKLNELGLVKSQLSMESGQKESVGDAKHRLLFMAYDDPFLGPESLKPGVAGMELINNSAGDYVGFVMPMKGDRGYQRVGSIYIEPKWRGKRIAEDYVQLYFKDKPGQAWIRPTNTPSQKTFRSAGFYRTGRTTKANGNLYEEWVNRAAVFAW